jgi:phage baseplate assembly protein W
MPVERVSKGFKDISASFQVNPLSYDLIAIKNETAIARSVRNLVLTNQGERFFNPILGSKVSRLLFENVDEITAAAIQEEITTTINNFEPRVNLLSVDVSPDYDNGEFNVTVRYEIVGIDVLPQQLSFALQPTR